MVADHAVPRTDVLAWTPLAQALFGDFSALPAGRRPLTA